ncbi:VIT1/CCC1 transporter family protein [Celeribacter persicus]|uniref:VIT1/CCC1 family predicted Fe2+/Mn2+ transporter n=1 Tax=Celeribacter persicus TaxID=1651082 RepID=A0A2T5HK43_9RHOB|nr:VIT1/CCC1 transporter family protein [Celeribacter persicus]PTQ71951.1 VIT1/CCC1 family predicted Fe2+/Mn2+ transporter [Celeribacter persicus]
MFARPNLTDHLKQIVYGGNDGIVTTFAIVAGFAGANAEGGGELATLAVLVFGLANLFADATSMGLGEFLSARAARDMIRRRQARLSRDPSAQIGALTRHLKDHGLSTLDATTMASLAAKSPGLMAEMTLSQVEGLEDPGQGPLWPRALITFLSFVSFGVIPILPYLLGLPGPRQFAAAVAAAGIALTLLGLLRHVATRAGLCRAVGETVFLGGICALVAYAVGLIVAG